MKLKSFGCSFIHGTDLSDAIDPSTPSQLTWPALLAKRYNLKYRCSAGGGLGNLAILDRLSYDIYRDPTDIFVVQWTYIDRFDYSDPNGNHFDLGENDWNSILPGHQTTLSKLYFYSLHSEYRDRLTALIYVKTAIDLLLQFDCRFIMTYLDQILLCDRWHLSPAMRSWQSGIATYLCDFDGQDFVTWSRQQRYAVGQSGHPLEPAHAAAADLMQPIIESILHRA